MTAAQSKTQRPYQPCNAAHQHVQLPPDLVALIEPLAQQVHDGWACQRLTQGWTLGPHRDDARKQHPNLVPYAELSEGDKDLDRQVGREALRALVALGYRITKP